MPSGTTMVAGTARALVLALAATALAPVARVQPPAAAVDLDVAVPPGSPLEWGRSFPASTPRRGPLFPKTPQARPPVEPGRTVARPRKLKMDPRASTSFGLIRILTWDLALHLSWVSREPPTTPPPGPITGDVDLVPPRPFQSEAMYWISIAPLLRMMLHPAATSRLETLAHLIELGPPVLPVLDSASSERSLKSYCEYLEEEIDVRRKTPVALSPDDPRERMLARFVLRELLSEHPYDPEARFGHRLFLLGEEIQPLVAGYLDSEDPLLARNALAAYGRYAGGDVGDRLHEIVAETDDKVMLMRALSALGSGRFSIDAEVLLKRLGASRDDVEQVALIGALGIARSADAIAPLAAIAKRPRVDSDFLIAILTAFARFESVPDSEVLRDFAVNISRRTGNTVRGFQPKGVSPSQQPDVPDPPALRGEILRQLSWILNCRLDPGDDKSAKRLLHLVKGVDVNGPGLLRGPYTNRTLRLVHPPVQYLYMEIVGDLGTDGLDVLELIARDKAVEPALRGFALGQLPTDRRDAIAIEILKEEAEQDEARIYALDILIRDAHEDTREIALELLEDCAKGSFGEGPAPTRFLHLTALRYFVDRDGLAADEVLLLVPAVQREGRVVEDRAVEVRRRVKDLCEQAVARVKRQDLRDGIVELIDWIVAHRLGRVVTAGNSEAMVERVLEMVYTLRTGRNGRQLVDSMSESITHFLLGTSASPLQSKEFNPHVPLEEEIVLALGRMEDGRAIEALVSLLQDKLHPLRAAVCLALGGTGDKKVARHLVPVLIDQDPFTRFCAYESLRFLTGEDHFTDWLFGTTREHALTAEKYARWISENR